MSELTDLQAKLADIGRRKAAADRGTRDAHARVRGMVRNRDALLRRNDVGGLQRLDTQRKQAEADHARAASTGSTLSSAEDNALGQVYALGPPQKAIEGLDDSYPIMLFPLRLETRFMQHGSRHELWVRVFPDDCQVQTFTDFISDAELRDVRQFWINFWKAGGFSDQQRAAWRSLVASHGSGRAQLLVERYRPNDVAPTKPKIEDILLVIAPAMQLSDEQRQHAEDFWIALWRAGKDAQARNDARATLTAAVGVAAAEAIVGSWRPSNLGDEPIAPFERTDVGVMVKTIDLPDPAAVATTPTSWNAAPRATTLPECFVFTGLRDDQAEPVFEKRGKRIPSTLAVGPDPSLPDAKQIKSANGELTLNEELRWLTDFDEAIERGMGIKISLSAKDYAAGVDKLVVLGVRLSSDAERGAELLEALLSDHRASKSGFALLPQGTPTNNTEAAPSGYTWQDDPEASFDRAFGAAKEFAITSDPLAKCDGQVLAELLGVDVGVVRQVAHADGLDQAHARAMNTALWPTTWGYFFESMVGPQLDATTAERLRTFFIRYISGRGAAPAIRIGKQPYGILPATVRGELYMTPETIPEKEPIQPQVPTPLGGSSQTGPGPARAQPGEIQSKAATIHVQSGASQPGLSHVQPSTPPVSAIALWPVGFLDDLKVKLDLIHNDMQVLVKDIAHVKAKADDDAEQTVLDVLGLHPTSVEYYSRIVMTIEQRLNQIQLADGPIAYTLAALVFGELAEVRAKVLKDLGMDVDPPEDIPMLDKLLDDAATPLAGGVVDDVELSESTPIRSYSSDGKNYLAWLATAGFDKVRREDFGGAPKPRALLYMLARYALLMTYWDASVRLLVAHQLVDDTAVRRNAQFLQVGDQVDGPSRWEPLLRTDPQVTGDGTTAIGVALDSPQLSARPQSARLREVKAAVAALANASTASLERLFAEHIDLCSYRLDAWRLGLVHHRLAQQRQRHARGIYLGAYGWLENLRPENKPLTPVTPPSGKGKSVTRATRAATSDSSKSEVVQAPSIEKAATTAIMRDSTNGGYIHAPSINQATAAAILRNAYMTHATADEPGTMSVNLSSARVRAAMGVIEGLQHGQGLSELLGYQFERGLHDAHQSGDDELESFLLPLRRRFPLVADKITTTAAGQGDEPAARNVIDGLALLRRANTGGNESYPFGYSADLPSATSGQKAAINALLDQLRNTNDAVADLMLAEGVYQVVQGQTERAANAVDAVGRGVTPHVPEIIRTPRSGTVVVNRVALHLDEGASAPAMATPRAIAEPAVDAWLATRLPSPADVACAVRWHDPAHGTNDAVVTMADLGLAPIDLLFVAALDGQQQASELDDRIERCVRASMHHPATVVTIRYTEPVPGKVSFFELASLVRELRVLVLQARPLAATDMMRSADAQGEPRWDAAELAARVTVVIDTLSSLADQLDARAADVAATSEQQLALTEPVLLAVALHGVPRTGLGALRARMRESYDQVAKKLMTVIARWEQQAEQYDTIVGGLAALADDAARRDALEDAEALVSSSPTESPPDDVATYTAIVAAKRAAFDGALEALRAPLNADVASLAQWLALVAAAVAMIPSVDSVWLDIERKANDLAPELAGLDKIGAAVRSVATAVSATARTRIASARALVEQALASDDAAVAVPLLEGAAKQVLGVAMRVVPRFTLGADPGAEFRSAYLASPELLDDLRANGRDFPVDDWFYGAARVRQKLGHLETSIALCEAFGRTAGELTPVQLPYREDDRWAALELPADYPLDEEKLLYTANFATPFDDTIAQRGLVLDEWTEIIPADDNTTGIAFHFDQPNTEPPQAILLVTPPVFRGHWKWDTVMNAITDTFEEAKLRAIEPPQVATSLYGQFLPASLIVLTKSLLTISVNLADNNG